MPGPAFLRGDEVSLHPAEEEDLEFLRRHRNDPDVRTGLTIARPQNAYEAEQAHERHAEDDSGVGLLIVPADEDGVDEADSATGEADAGEGDSGENDSAASDAAEDAADPVGQIVLFDIDETHGTGELSAWITPDAQGNGYATAGTRLMLRHAFDERRLRKVVARALVDNEASRATLEGLGMAEEGVQRHEKYVGGDYRDVVRYSMLRREWGER